MSMKTPSFNKNSNHLRRASRFHMNLIAPMVFFVVEAIAFLGAIAALGIFYMDESNHDMVALVILAVLILYLLSAGSICLFCVVKAGKLKKAALADSQIESEIYDMFRYTIDYPYTIIDREGKVKVINGALQDILGIRHAVSGIDFSEFCSVPVNVVAATARNRDDFLHETIFDLPGNATVPEIAITRLSDGRRYETIPYIFKIHGENYYFTAFKDIEDHLALEELHERESAVVAYIILDNLQELTQYVRADYRQVSTEVETILKEWVGEMHGVITEYENDKYIAVFSKEELDRQMGLDFDIQQKIMSMQIGDNSFPVTISMGIAAIDGTFRDKEKAAFDALDIAVKRGGNQVAIRREDSKGYVFFGGTHKVIENNTAVVSRVSGEILEEKLGEATGILIMGHSNPDFDSVGSCVGMARLAMEIIAYKHSDLPESERPRVNIVINKNNDTFKTCYAQLEPMGIYEDIFITKEDAKDLVTSGTALVICDVNNPMIYEAPELVKMISSIAILDHHRLASALTFEPFLQYVEATKSSASEIVSEIIFRSRYGDKLHKEEAEVLLSGIMLDTNNFTRNAGAQTFEITHYLYGRGAHTTVVREFFNESLEELMMTGEFESKARIYRDCVAITWMALDRPATPEDRIVASKVADKLLRIRSVEASFALIRMDNDVVISGRSKGGINVQLILERLKGGGHFDIAGAQVRNSNLTKACEMLKDAIDDYFEYDHKSSTSN